MRNAIALVAAAIAVWPCPPVAAQSLQARLQARLDSVHAAGRFPGATVGVALADGRAFGWAVGFADTARKEPMRVTHRMLQGSVGKTYFAAVALQLVREGRLQLDDRLEKYLAGEAWWEAPDGRVRLPNGAAVTIRQLMTHTSGVVRYEFKEEFQRDLTRDPQRVWQPADRLAYVLDTQPPFAAGQGWEYSDTNYILLGMVIEKITGSAAYREIERRLLAPNALRNTIPSDRAVLPGVAQGYAGPNNPFGGADAMIVDGKFTVNPQLEWAGGGFASTAEDLARWAAVAFSGKAFGPDLLQQAVQAVEARGLGTGVRYGLGVIVRETPIGVSYGHSGFFPGYLTEVRYYPQLGFAIALQFNTSVGRAIGRNPGVILQELAGIVASDLAQTR
ncbi:MAG: serine hydrolase domain-containing protein [Longimicrobiales bacterium]